MITPDGNVEAVILYEKNKRDPTKVKKKRRFKVKVKVNRNPKNVRDPKKDGGAAKGNPRYRFLGITRYWRFSKKRMEKMYADELIVQRRKGTVPLQKRYLDEMPGIMLQDIWSNIQSVQLSKREAVGYPTQKPTQLLDRVIQISSNPKDVVLDAFCGSGTTLVAALNLGRNYLGIDKNPDACNIARRRLRNRKIEQKPKQSVIIQNYNKKQRLSN